MTLALEGRVARKLDTLDVRREPLKVAEGAHLLADVQEYARLGSTLEARVAAFVDGGSQSASTRSLADWAFDVLSEAGGELHYREIAARIRAQGFTHSRKPKNNPEKQLRDSVWSAMYEDERFVKVGRGIFDLQSRR
jgi:HB1, ASXL, restriction endonuclease HTH domain